MGCWSADSFGNDDALDWLLALHDNNGSMIADALGAVAHSSEDYIEATACCTALAAAEIVAAVIGKPDKQDLPPEVMDWIEKHKLSVSMSLVEMALKVVQRIETNSELKDLWDESEEKYLWYEDISDLKARLK